MFLYSTVSTLKPGGREEGRQRRAGDDVGGVIGTRTDGGDSRDNLAELELVEDGGLTSGIETDLGQGSGPSTRVGGGLGGGTYHQYA